MVSSWRSWGYLGLSWSQVGGLGAILARRWDVLATSWVQDGEFGSHLGSKMGVLGAILVPSWEVLGPSWGSWPETRDFHGFCGVLGGSKSLRPAWVEGETWLFELGGEDYRRGETIPINHLPTAKDKRPETRDWTTRQNRTCKPIPETRNSRLENKEGLQQPGGPHKGGRRIV